MKLIMILILLTASSANCDESVNWLRRCAWPMTLTFSIAFQIPTGSITGGYEDYNITEYRFDLLACMCSTIVQNTENYDCRSGNIIEHTSLILNDGNLNLDTGRIICKTTNGEIPTVKAQGHFNFSCKETETVQPRIVHDEVNKYSVIKPASFHRSNDRNSSEWNRLLDSGPGFRFKFDDSDELSKSHFRAYWRGCLSIIIIGREGGSVSLQQQEKDFGQLLAKLLQSKDVMDFTSLEITRSNLTVLPNTICQYESLQRFAVVDNEIQVLPACLHNMLKLKFLDFSFNALKSINEITFGSGRYQTYLDLSFNQITYIKDNAFSQLTSLVFLSLRNNALTEVNFHFSSRYSIGLPILQLDLSHNSIKYLPYSISKLTKIMTLLFQHNEIEKVDFIIPSSLGFLDLSYNRLDYIDSRIFKDATNLLTLNLANNHLKTFQMPWDILPGAGFGYMYMEFINLKHNLIENLDESLFWRTPKTLDFSYNRLKVIDLNILRKANYLETLRLDHNNITEILDGVLNGTQDITILPKINYMNISNNKLKVAPLSLIFLNVQIIDFSNNKIEKCTWSNMPNAHILKNIDEKILGSCIKSYDHKRDPLRNLVLLDHNRIKSLKDVFGRTSIMVHRYATLLCHVHLPNNPFHCDCKAYPYLRAIHDFISQAGQNEADDTKNVIISKDRAHEIFYWNHGEQYPCDTPTSMKSYSLLDKDLLDELSCNLLPQEDCQILFKPSVPILIINCSNLNLNKLPVLDAGFSIKLNMSATKHHVPEGIDVNIYLNQNNFSQISLDHSENLLITEILERSIKGHVKVLDLSYSSIADIDNEFLFYLSEKLSHLTHLYLNGNKLTKLTLDEHTLSLQKGSHTRVPFWERLTELHLYNNTWDCSCSAMLMIKLLNRLIARKTLVRPDEIVCVTPERNRGRMVYMVDDESLCEDTKLAFYIEQHFVLNMTLALLVLWLTWKFFKRETIQLLTLTRDAIVNDDDITGMVFDAFVSYCEDDRVWVEQELIPCLQQNEPPYKICQHRLNFVPGFTVQQNEFNAIKHSRRTIIVMSNAYLGREHCQYEFKTAYNYWITEKEHPRLVVVKYPDVEDRNQFETCHAYFRKFTYLEKDENTFDRLLAFMPRRSLRQYASEVDNNAAELFTGLSEYQQEADAIQDLNCED